MAILARNLFKIFLLAGLFLLSIRYIYSALLFLPAWNERYSFVVSEFLGFHDIEFFDAVFGLSASLIMAIIEYLLLRRFWRRYWPKRHPTP